MFKTTALDSVANAYVDKDVGGGTPGTRLEADDRNIIQDEIVNVVEGAGLPLDPTGADRDQLLQAINLISVLPPGSMISWPTDTPPTGWFERDGAAISRATYGDLFAIIGVIYGNGDGVTTFNLPDARGKFDRAWDNGAGNDPDAATRTNRGDGTTGDNVGTNQGSRIESHDHPSSADVSTGSQLLAAGGFLAANAGSNTGLTGGNQTAPINTSVMKIIKW